MTMKNYIESGRVTSVRGLFGEIKVQTWCNSVTDFCKFKRFFLKSDGSDEFKVVYSKNLNNNSALLKLYGINSIEDAKAFINKILYVDRKDIPIQDGEHLLADIIGLEVLDSNNNDLVYGKISNIITGNSRTKLYEIVQKNGKHCLIPDVKEVIKEIDTKQGILKIKPMKGLFDISY